MTNALITTAAFIAAISTVLFERFIQPSLELTYRYLMSELGGEPVLAPAVAMPAAAAAAAAAPVEAKTLAETKPATRRRTTRKKVAAPKATPAVAF